MIKGIKKVEKMIKFKPIVKLPLKPIHPSKKGYKEYLKKTTKYWFYLV
jgi:hypothetical protein